MVTLKGSMSTEGETLYLSVLPYRCSIFPPCCICLGCCAADFGSSGRTYELPCIKRRVENLVTRVPGVQDYWILGAHEHPLHIKRLYTSRAHTAPQITLQPLLVVWARVEQKNVRCLCRIFNTARILWCQFGADCQKLRMILLPSTLSSSGPQTFVINISMESLNYQQRSFSTNRTDCKLEPPEL